MTKPLRIAMPLVTEFLDALRENGFFHRQQINESIKAGIDGQPVFWAKENGLEVGTRFQIDPEKAISGSDLYLETKKKAINP
jgi:hypothetical protein